MLSAHAVAWFFDNLVRKDNSGRAGKRSGKVNPNPFVVKTLPLTPLRSILWREILRRGNNILAESEDSGDDEQEGEDSAIEGRFSVPHDHPPKWLIMLYEYCDESGHERRDQYTIIAGFLGNKDQWCAFLKEWLPALGKRKSLHTRKLFRNERRAQSLLSRLGPIPAKHGLRPFVSGVRADDYWDLVGGTPVEKRAKGYCTALHALVIDALLYAPRDERIEFIFESQNEYESCANALMEAVLRSKREEVYTPSGLPQLANWGFIPKESSRLTEPADYLANAVLQYHRDPNSVRWTITRPIVDAYPELDLLNNGILSKETIREVTINSHAGLFRRIAKKHARSQEELEKVERMILDWLKKARGSE